MSRTITLSIGRPGGVAALISAPKWRAIEERTGFAYSPQILR